MPVDTQNLKKSFSLKINKFSTEFYASRTEANATVEIFSSVIFIKITELIVTSKIWVPIEHLVYKTDDLRNTAVLSLKDAEKKLRIAAYSSSESLRQAEEKLNEVRDSAFFDTSAPYYHMEQVVCPNLFFIGSLFLIELFLCWFKNIDLLWAVVAGISFGVFMVTCPVLIRVIKHYRGGPRYMLASSLYLLGLYETARYMLSGVDILESFEENNVLLLVRILIIKKQFEMARELLFKITNQKLLDLVLSDINHAEELQLRMRNCNQ